MATPARSVSTFRFGVFALDSVKSELRKGDTLLKLHPQPFRVLVLLVERAGEIVTREEIQRSLWGDHTWVDFDGGINFCICQIRAVLGDDAVQPRYVETVPRHGYRFIFKLTASEDEEQVIPISRAATAPERLIGQAENAPHWGGTSEERADKALRKQRGWLAGGIALGAIAIAGLVLLFLHPRRVVAIDSIAVMPFTNATGDASLDYLDDGLTQSLINNLSQLRHLRVMSWNAVYGYKGKAIDARKVGKDLGVQAVFTGRTVRQGDRLSINTELLDTRDDSLIRGEQYLRTPDDLSVFQGELSRDILTQLRQNLTPEQVKQVSKPPTANPEAYRLFLEGLFYSNLLTPSNLERSAAYLQQAIAKDENFALAYATLARTDQLLTVVGRRPLDLLPQAKAAALRAIELDPELAVGHQSLGWILWQLDWDYPGAEREVRRAVELRPNSWNTHFQLALVVMQLRRFDEGASELRRAQELDRWEPDVNCFLAMPYYFMRNYEQAAKQLQKALDVNSSYYLPHMFMGRVLTQQRKYAQALAEYETAGRASLEPVSHIGYVQAITGHRAEAQQTIRELIAMRKRRFVQPSDVARIYAGLGDRDSAIAWLNRGAQEKEFGLALFNIDPEFEVLHSDPRFQELMRHVGLTR